METISSLKEKVDEYWAEYCISIGFLCFFVVLLLEFGLSVDLVKNILGIILYYDTCPMLLFGKTKDPL